MESLNIRSHMTSFRLLDRITLLEPQRIDAQADFKGAPLFAAIETMAQLGALHVRHLIRCESHAFLLKVNGCRLPNLHELNGKAAFTARLLHRSDKAYCYRIFTQDQARLHLEAELLFATIAYDDTFEKERLTSYYRNMLTCLQNATDNN